jgi:hypothetical protein
MSAKLTHFICIEIIQRFDFLTSSALFLHHILLKRSGPCQLRDLLSRQTVLTRASHKTKKRAMSGLPRQFHYTIRTEFCQCPL